MRKTFKVYIRGITISKQSGVLRSIRAQLRSLKTELTLVEWRYDTLKSPVVLAEMNRLMIQFREAADREVAFLGKQA